MKLPRDLSGGELASKLLALGYKVTRQTGSHIRLTTNQQGEHHITIPNHASLRVGTLSGIVAEVAKHFQKTKDEILEGLF
jgi:predicted RNA binding protein YcfA (HicA-like mRNA interferase family)